MPRLTDFAYPHKPISARYKSSAKTSSIERPCPHIVELIVPLKGFGYTLKKMQDWHQARGLEQRRRSGGYAEPHWYCRWCFANPLDAIAFQAAFGGELTEPSTKELISLLT